MEVLSAAPRCEPAPVLPLMGRGTTAAGAPAPPACVPGARRRAQPRAAGAGGRATAGTGGSAPLVPGDVRRAAAAEGSPPRGAGRAGQGRAGPGPHYRGAAPGRRLLRRRGGWVAAGGSSSFAGCSMAVKVTLPLRRLWLLEAGGPPRGGGRRTAAAAAAAGASRGPGGAAGGGGDGEAARGKGQHSLPCRRVLRWSGEAAGARSEGPAGAGGGPVPGGRGLSRLGPAAVAAGVPRGRGPGRSLPDGLSRVWQLSSALVSRRAPQEE